MTTVMQWVGQRRKAWQALGAVVLTWAGAVIAGNGGQFGNISDLQWLALAVGLAGVLGVHEITNDPIPAKSSSSSSSSTTAADPASPTAHGVAPAPETSAVASAQPARPDAPPASPSPPWPTPAPPS